MKTKVGTKKYYTSALLIGLILALVAVLFLFGGFGGNKSASAAAATTPKYALAFDYSYKYTYGSAGGSSTSNSDGKDAYSAHGCAISIWGSGSSGSGSLPKGGYIGSSTVNMSATGISTPSITVKNSSGTKVGSGSSFTMTGLYDGTYSVSVNFGSRAWTINSRAGASESMTGTSSFTVDTTPPIISGAARTTAGKYTNAAFTVSASDSASGLDTMYMKNPTASSYTVVGSSITIPAGSVNGLYSFYAKDKVGNTSITHYVYYDTSLPTVSLKSSSGADITGNYTNSSFYCTALDTGSTVNYMQYRTPSNTSWSTYVLGTTIDSAATNGAYQFRAVDRAGNVSATKLVYLDTEKPKVKIYGSDKEHGQATFSSDYIKFVPSDTLSGIKTSYIKPPGATAYTSYMATSQFTTNGEYSFYCVDNAGNRSMTYTATLDNVAPVLSCSQTDFYTTTENDFTVKSTDATSYGILFYKTPLMDDFQASNDGSYSVITTDSDGKYYFYTEDVVGNRSETKWIELQVAKPTATIVRDNKTNHYRITWDGSSTGRLNDNPYTKDTWITTEGEYTFVITNSSNRSNTYRFTIAHGFVVTQIVRPTCTEKGYTTYKCLTCDASYNSDYVDANGHSYDEQLIGETCTEGAYYLYTCSVCGHEYKSEYLTVGGHKYDKTPVKANCTDRGYTIYKCTVCDYTFRDDYTAALGHNFKITVLDPTCTEGGHSTFECKRCDYEYVSDYTPAKGHSYEETVVQANCTDRGYTLHKCSACGDEYKTDEVLALGHYYTERTQEVSCTQNGCIVHTCTRCGYEYETNVTPALGHKYVTEVTLPATCEEDGNRHYICARCGDQYGVPILAFGHSYEISDVHTDGGVTIRTYTCSICGHSYTQDLGDQYEEVSNYVEYLFMRYSPYMWWVFLAVAGVWSIAMGIAIIVAHKNEDKQKARKMLVNYVIGLVVIAAILVACPYLVRGIAALIAS